MRLRFEKMKMNKIALKIVRIQIKYCESIDNEEFNSKNNGDENDDINKSLIENRP